MKDKNIVEDHLTELNTDPAKNLIDRIKHLLDKNWEYFLHPWLNGLQPDLIMMHPIYGVVIANLQHKHDTGISIHTKNDLCRSEIKGLYSPRLGDRRKTYQIKLMPNGILFDQALRASTISYQHLANLLEYTDKKDPPNLSEELEDLRQWLIPPDTAIEQSEPLKLTKRQIDLATKRTPTGYKRIKGPAGSGKSLVIAHKAAKLLSEGKNVAILPYNITLINYLSNAAIRIYPKAKTRGVWLNFHSLAKRLCYLAEMSGDWKLLFTKNFPSPTRVSEICNQAIDKMVKQGKDPRIYDAILVDEGQDYHPTWWSTLRRLHKENAEMFFVADETQDIYGQTKNWTQEVMSRAGFDGSWGKLTGSARLPEKMIHKVAEFARTFISIQANTATDSILTSSLPLWGDIFQAKWNQVNDRNSLIRESIKEIQLMIASRTKEEQTSIFDVTVLVQNKKTGKDIVDILTPVFGNKLSHTFGEDSNTVDNYEIERSRKFQFGLNPYLLRITTIQSFKGWESRLLILVIESAKNLRDMSLVYVGLTRLKHHPLGSFITVVSSTKELAEYGKTWANESKDNINIEYDDCDDKSEFEYEYDEHYEEDIEHANRHRLLSEIAESTDSPEEFASVYNDWKKRFPEEFTPSVRVSDLNSEDIPAAGIFKCNVCGGTGHTAPGLKCITCGGSKFVQR